MDPETYLVFDIETYPDKSLVQDVHGKSVEKLREDLSSRRESTFLPPIFHIPIVLAAIEISADFKVRAVDVYRSPTERERDLLSSFWERCNSLAENSLEGKPRGCIVTFNGSRFDLRVLEQRALKYGLRCNTVFRAPDYHFDVPLFLSNFEEASKRGLSLKALSRLIDLPGKSLLEGSDVESAYDRGEIHRISEYCLLDALQTYLLFLRCLVLEGAEEQIYSKGFQSLVKHLSLSSDPVVREASHHLGPAIHHFQGAI
jgi:predicted PolB exonuclease-like 3'-5' exonuclease